VSFGATTEKMIFSSAIDALRSVAWVLLPPAGLFWSAALGICLYWRWRRAGSVLVGASLIGLGILALPITSYGLLSLGVVPSAVERGGSPPAHAAIVVLGADVRRDAREYGPITLGPLSLERLRYAARLHRRTGLPVLVSGGRLRADDRPLAALMYEVLAEDFGIEARWVEDRSRNTAENARFSVELLRGDGISTVLVVTHAWHMRRALMAFRDLGMKVLPAPTLAPHRPTKIDMVIPSVSALYGSFLGIHELVGRLFYRVAD
jgi:uncharacterized SAM-binding protein YcdF (DUF218 family)